MATSVASTPRSGPGAGRKTTDSNLKKIKESAVEQQQPVEFDSQLNNDMLDLPFLKQDHFSDVVLQVGGKKLYTSRALLAYNSPVLAKILLSGSSKHKDLDLPEKDYDDILELMAYIDPRVDYIITEQSAIALLPLADEYEVMGLKQLCEETITAAFRSIRKAKRSEIPVEISLEYLHLADRYRFSPLRELCIKELVANPDPYCTKALLESQMVSELSKIDVLDRKVEHVHLELDKERRERTTLETRLGDYGNKRVSRRPLMD